MFGPHVPVPPTTLLAPPGMKMLSVPSVTIAAAATTKRATRPRTRGGAGGAIGLGASGGVDTCTVGGAYVTGGLELGHSLIGVDGGAALRLRDGTTDLGATGRVVIGAGVFSLYVRYAYFDADRDPHVIQVGALLKLPLVSPFGGH